jgi:hypothetical protein
MIGQWCDAYNVLFSAGIIDGILLKKWKEDFNSGKILISIIGLT